jgi:hypothetical protein
MRRLRLSIAPVAAAKECDPKGGVSEKLGRQSQPRLASVSGCTTKDWPLGRSTDYARSERCSKQTNPSIPVIHRPSHPGPLGLEIAIHPRAWVSTGVDLHGTRKLGLRMISVLRSLRILCVLCVEGAVTRLLDFLSPLRINDLRGSYPRARASTWVDVRAMPSEPRL